MTVNEIREDYLAKKGREQGRKEGKEEIAISMLKDGESIEKIMKYTKLTRAVIVKLEEEIKKVDEKDLEEVSKEILSKNMEDYKELAK